MTQDDQDPNLVRVSLSGSAEGPNAICEPVFLIQVGDVYYATLSVWEYSPAPANEDNPGYDIVKAYFLEHQQDVVGAAIQLKIGDPPTMTSTTNPPRPAQTPTRPAQPIPANAPVPDGETTGEPPPDDSPAVPET
jgi:hypothetical protein